MRPPSSASSGGHFPAKIDPANRLKCPPLPDRFVTGLRCAFQLLDIEGTGRIPYEQICKKWPIHFSEAPVPSNFLECLHRVIPSEEMVTFENFIKGAHLALQERMSTAGRLKRVQSEGKLLGSDCESAHKEESYRPKSRTPSTPGPHPLRTNGHPSMGLSGRKMDGRGDADHRLVRLKRASRSQPQLNEMFDGQKNITRTLRRTNCLQENKFNFHFADRNGSAASVKNGNDFKIVYRTKKNKAPPPPEPSNESLNGSDNRRPISAASTVTSTIVPSLSTSRQSSTATFNNGKHQIQNSAVHNNCSNNYADELQPQVAKHERLLDEEFDIVKMGTKKAQELMDWYAGRNESLEKRKRMLNKGMVALDSAVHEQKLNFHRAQIAEMNRRIAAFLTSSERGGFPSHSNILNSNSSLTTQPQPQQIRSQVLPPPFPPQSCSSSVPNSSSNCSSSSSSSAASSAPDSNFCTASEAEFLRAQNQKLTKDIQMLAREVEQMRVERHRPPSTVVATVVPPYQHHQQQKQKMNGLNGAIGHQQHRGRNDYLTMWHSVPIPSPAGFPPFHPPPKDTLL